MLLFSLTVLLTVGCGGDEDNKPSDCSGVLSDGGQIEVDGEEFDLNISQLLISQGLDGDVYSFQVSGISNDCNEIKGVSFIVEIPTGSELDGSYTIKDFFDAELNDVYGVTYTAQVIDILSQTSVSVVSGTINFTRHSARDYTIDLNGVLTAQPLARRSYT